MDDNKQFFLRVLSDHLKKQRTEASSVRPSLDWKKISFYAQSHQLSGILYYQCKDLFRRDDMIGEAKAYASTLFYYSNRQVEFKKIADKLIEEKIPFFTVKGYSVAQYYPVPTLRTMGDCDIVVHSEDKLRAHEVMLSLGFENEFQQKKEWTYYKNKMEFEIHDRLLYDDVVNSKDSKDFMDMDWEYTTQAGGDFSYELDWNFHLVFLLLHLKKHILNSGAGFRLFMDLVVVVHNQELNWIWITEMLQKLELMKFTEVCFSLCERWFDIEMPISTTLEETFFEQSTEKIFRNGVFGFEDKSNSTNLVYNKVDKLGKYNTIIGFLFPKYQDIRHVPYYSFVDNRPWLLPLAWIYRYFRALRYGKWKYGKKFILAAVTSDEKAAERNYILRKWGL